MKNIIVILSSVILSTVVVGMLFYFNLFPHKDIASLEPDKGSQIVISEENKERGLEKLEEVENMIKEVAEEVNTESTCRQASEVMAQIEMECGSVPFPGVEKCIQMRIERSEVELKEQNLARAEKMKTLNKEYLSLNASCE